MTAGAIARWTAIAMAVAAVIDPRVPWPHRARPPVRVDAGSTDASAVALRTHLAGAGFATDHDTPVAIVAARGARVSDVPEAPLFALGPDGAPGVAIERVEASAVRFPGQAVSIAVTVRAHGATGRATELRLEDAGLTVATARHQWTKGAESWQTTLSYRPPGAGIFPLRVVADALDGETDAADNAADVLAPAERPPLKTLVFTPQVSWPTVFVRRALEASPAFAVASALRATPRSATRTGDPPASLTRAALEPFAVLLCGVTDLRGAAADAVRWFVEERGGVVILVADRVPSGEIPMVPGVTFESRVLDRPLALAAQEGPLRASELAVPRGVPALALPLAVAPGEMPIVFAVRRGEGAVIVSGALDAWRYREAGEFARFWPAAILGQAAAVPPPLAITVAPALARSGESIAVTARVRPQALPAGESTIVMPPVSARVFAASPRSDTPLRLWPGATPGVYEGAWRAGAPGEYAVDVSVGGHTAATVLRVTEDAARPVVPGALALAASASGGGVFADEASLTRALAARFPRVTTIARLHLTRSPWWAGACAMLLCVEWALRRRRGRA